MTQRRVPVEEQPSWASQLRSLRLGRGLSQADLGRLLGVSQKRIARIEAAPGKAGFGQILSLCSTLGYTLAVQGPGSGVSTGELVRASLLQGRGRPGAGGGNRRVPSVKAAAPGRGAAGSPAREEALQARPGVSGWSVGCD